MRIVLEEFSCLRCREKFYSKHRPPRRCGKCKSPYWNKPRRGPMFIKRRANQ